ncbi:hypothetical protein ACHAWC_010125, partial [Mediolabrus comicus]
KVVAAILNENSTIQVVDLQSNNISGEGAKAIADTLKHNKTLQHIDLSRNNIGVDGAKAIAEALEENIELRMIDLRLNQIAVEGAKAIANALHCNKTLQHIDLSSNEIGDEGLKTIADALKVNLCLQELSLEKNNFGEEGGMHILNALQHIDSSAIETISLWGNQISLKTIEQINDEIARFKRRFRIVGSNEGRVAAVATAAGELQQRGTENERSNNRNEGLPTIHKTNSRTDEESEQPIKEEAKQITGRKIEEKQTTIAQLQGKIAEQDEEKIASIMIIDIADLRREHVAELAKTRVIWIKGRHSVYTDKHWNILAEVIRTTTSLKTLGFKFRNAIIALQNDKVIDALAKNVTIKELDLGSISAGNSGAKVVAAILKENSTIQEVKLHNNRISGEGAKAIAEALLLNKTLRNIHLSCNQIGVAAAKAIAEALKVNKALRYIDMNQNQIGDEGAKAIANALKHNASVQTICLRWNNIGNEGTKAFAEALKESTSLQTLSMVNNYIGQEGGEHILNALQQIENSAISDVVLWEDKAWEETQRKINQEIDRIQRRFRIAGSVVPSTENENKEPQEDRVVEDMKQPSHDPVRDSKKPLLVSSFDDDDEGEVEEVHPQGRRGRSASATSTTPKQKKMYSSEICKAPDRTKSCSTDAEEDEDEEDVTTSSPPKKRARSDIEHDIETEKVNDDDDDELSFDDPPRLRESEHGVSHYCKVKKCDKWSQGRPKMGMCNAHFTLYIHYQEEEEQKKRVNDDINNFLNDQKKKVNDDVNNFLNAWLLRPENVLGNPIKAATPTTEVKEWMAKELCVERSRIDSWFYRRRKKLKKQNSPDQASDPSSTTTPIAASHLLTQTSSGTNPNLNHQAENKQSESKVGAQTSQPRHVLLTSCQPAQMKMNQPQPSYKPKQHEKQQLKQEGQPIVKPEDKPLLLDYFYLGFGQYHTCSLQVSERREHRYKKFERDYPGIACKHCDGKANRRCGSGQGRFFPSSEAALYQQTFSNNAVRHLLECPYCPEKVKQKLSAMKEELDNTDGKGKFVKEKGGRLRFFRRVWCRLHGIPIDKETASPIKIKRRGKQLKRKREQWESEKTPSATNRTAKEPTKKVMKAPNPYPTKEMRDKIMAHFKIEDPDPRTLDGFLTSLKLLNLHHRQSEDKVSAQMNQPRSGMESTASKHAKTRICRQSDCNKYKQYNCDGYCMRHYREIVVEGGEKGFEEGKEEGKVTEAAATVGDKVMPDVAKSLSAEPSEEDGKGDVAELTFSSPPTLEDAAAAGCKKCRLEYETGEKIRKIHNDDCPRK